MQTPDGRFTLVYNGEVYNYRALRSELEAEGIRFASRGDTEVVLNALALWGEAALERFLGMFALALWDGEEGTLLLARDRLGEKPLYWLSDERGIAFASETRALLATGWIRPKLDALGLECFLERGSCQDPSTLLEGVRALRPGHRLVASPRGIEVHRWWAPPEFHGTKLSPEWREALAALLEEAIELRLASAVPLGLFLSGGIDSAAILALAARRHRDEVSAFTLTFDEAAFDEGNRARLIASHVGVRHESAHLTAEEALDSIDSALEAQDLPSHDGLNTWFVARAARARGLVVALAGTGGDELFGGYTHFRRFPVWQRIGRFGRLLPMRLREELLDGLSASLPARVRKALALLSSGGEPQALYSLVREAFSPVQRRRLLGRSDSDTQSPAGDPDEARVPSPIEDSSHTLTRLELQGYLRDTQLRDIDSASMAHSLEVRAPLLDHRLVEFLMQVPAEAKRQRGALNKPLLAGASGLPHWLLRGPKRGFVLPWETWLRGPLRGYAAATLGGVHECSALEQTVVSETWQRFLRGGVGYSRILTLIALTRWCNRHGITSGPG
jgi:asparagine synthase (glutamine-hydrolysing)